jgi:hypothetical protein
LSAWWAVLWHTHNRLDGCDRHLIWDNTPTLFRTRRECRAYIEQKYGYIREHPELRTEPFGWHVPTAIRVRVEPT